MCFFFPPLSASSSSSSLLLNFFKANNNNKGLVVSGGHIPNCYDSDRWLFWSRSWFCLCSSICLSFEQHTGSTCLLMSFWFIFFLQHFNLFSFGFCLFFFAYFSQVYSWHWQVSGSTLYSLMYDGVRGKKKLRNSSKRYEIKVGTFWGKSRTFKRKKVVILVSSSQVSGGKPRLNLLSSNV